MMRNDEYIAQNSLGYEGDEFIHEELKKLTEKFDVHAAVETGTFKGATAKRLYELVRFVQTIELNLENYNHVKNFLPDMGITPWFGNSSDVLPKVLKYIDEVDIGGNILFYLDAHWESHCPLLDELKVIADFELKPIIMIHDFKVPDRLDLGYDCYADQVFEFNWIKASIEKIYGPDGYDYHYNSEASGAKRGVIYIYPKQ